VRVIGAGFGRTGTTSLKAALETLGFGPCYHMTEVFARPGHADAWISAWRGKPVDWDALLGEYEAAVDWPACTFYEELMERYPDAKVLLSVREPQSWYESARATIYELSKAHDRSRTFRALFALVSLFAFGGLARGRGELVNELIWSGTFGGRFEDREHAIRVFEEHNAGVARRVPPERLLVYNVKQGWGPLCAFLGVPEPDGPFPRLNDGKEMRCGVRVAGALSAAGPAALSLLAGAALVVLAGRLQQGPARPRKRGGQNRCTR
jgi:hypothetical protein